MTEFVRCHHAELDTEATLPRTALPYMPGWQPVDTDAAEPPSTTAPDRMPSRAQVEADADGIDPGYADLPATSRRVTPDVDDAGDDPSTTTDPTTQET